MLGLLRDCVGGGATEALDQGLLVCSAGDYTVRLLPPLVATRDELALLAHDAPAIALFFSEGTYAYRPAIYNGWVFITGTGILDKRSFLPAATQERPAPQSSEPGPADSGSGSALDLVNVISLIVLAVVIALATAALLQRRSDRR